jgi:hypothetical protein
MSKVEFDMPHALVTLTTLDGLVEIEVWPKSGQSAFVVLDPETAQAIAETLVGMVEELAVMPQNVVDLASRRKPN